MDLVGEKTLALPCATVWQSLNDPDILKQCLPGCESFTRTDAQSFEVILTASVGPIKARFTGQLNLSDMNPPHGYTLNFSGSGGAAGMGKGNAVVTLTAQDTGTVLSYKVKAHVSGRLAQVGNRLIDGVAAKMAEEFFNKFIQVVSPPAELVASAAATGDEQIQSANMRHQPLMWALAAALLVAGVSWFLK